MLTILKTVERKSKCKNIPKAITTFTRKIWLLKTTKSIPMKKIKYSPTQATNLLYNMYKNNIVTSTTLGRFPFLYR